MQLHPGWLALSALLAVVLLILLFATSDLHLHTLWLQLRDVRPSTVAVITLLVGLNNWLAGAKWRLIASRLQPDGPTMPRLTYFAFTSIGVALGQIVPAQLSLVLSRSLGAHLHGGSALSRGAAATLFDYFFDMLVAAFLVAASLVVLIAGGDGWSWLLAAVAICAAGFVLYGVATRPVAAVAQRLGAFAPLRGAMPLLRPDLGRRLLALSLLRYALLVAIGVISARAVGLHLPLWHIAASLPFAVLANALALTPGSLGVNEWTVSAALFSLGTPFATSAAWALVNRVLVALAAFLLGVAGLVIAVLAPRAQNSER